MMWFEVVSPIPQHGDIMDLKIDFSENNPKRVSKILPAMGGTELIQKWLFDRLDPELKDYFQFAFQKKKTRR